MEKSDWVKIVVVLIVVGFITEQFFFSPGFRSFFLGGGTAPSAGNVTGLAVFNGTIRTYDPLLALPQNTSQQLIDQLRNTPGVKGVQSQNGYVIVQTETRDDVYPLAQSLRQENVTAISVANVALPPSIDVAAGNATLNASTQFLSVVRVQMEPLLDADSEVEVQMVAVVSEDQLIDYQSAVARMQRLSLEANATVESLNYRIYTYEIPWENRTSIPNQSGYDYNRIDTVRLNPPLDTSQVVLKRLLPYIVYIDSASAVVEPSFDNATRMREDFQNITLAFPQSTLRVLVNGTDAAPSLPFSGTVAYSYVVALPPEVGGYSTGATGMAVETPEEHALNSTVQIRISALAMGNKLVSVSPS